MLSPPPPHFCGSNRRAGAGRAQKWIFYVWQYNRNQGISIFDSLQRFHEFSSHYFGWNTYVNLLSLFWPHQRAVQLAFRPFCASGNNILTLQKAGLIALIRSDLRGHQAILSSTSEPNKHRMNQPQSVVGPRNRITVVSFLNWSQIRLCDDFYTIYMRPDPSSYSDLFHTIMYLGERSLLTFGIWEIELTA